MLGDGIGSNVRKSKLINRRMFLASAAKAVVFFGIVAFCPVESTHIAPKMKIYNSTSRFCLFILVLLITAFR